MAAKWHINFSQNSWEMKRKSKLYLQSAICAKILGFGALSFGCGPIMVGNK
jgi:hypothetical protein